MYSLKWNSIISVRNMENSTIYELFEQLNPCEKATFIDARLEWATNGAICGEVTLRLCEPQNCE